MRSSTISSSSVPSPAQANDHVPSISNGFIKTFNVNLWFFNQLMCLQLHVLITVNCCLNHQSCPHQATSPRQSEGLLSSHPDDHRQHQHQHPDDDRQQKPQNGIGSIGASEQKKAVYSNGSNRADNDFVYESCCRWTIKRSFFPIPLTDENQSCKMSIFLHRSFLFN